MIYIDEGMREQVENQRDISKQRITPSKSSLDRSSKSIIDLYNARFDDLSGILQNLLNKVKSLSDTMSNIQDTLKKQYSIIIEQDIPIVCSATELEGLCEKVCIDEGQQNECNTLLETGIDITECVKVGDDSVMGCQTLGEGKCTSNCEVNCQSNCEEVCQALCNVSCQENCQQLSQGCGNDEDKCTTISQTSSCGECGACEGYAQTTDDGCLETGQSGCIMHGEAGCIGNGEANCMFAGEGDCKTSGEAGCIIPGEDHCIKQGEDECLFTGEKSCIKAGEDNCVYTGEDGCLEVGEAKCTESGEDGCIETGENGCIKSGEDNCRDFGEDGCIRSGEDDCRDFGEDGCLYPGEGDTCTAIADQIEDCTSVADGCGPGYDACQNPFADCGNSTECPPSFGDETGCGISQGCGACESVSQCDACQSTSQCDACQSTSQCDNCQSVSQDCGESCTTSGETCGVGEQCDACQGGGQSCGEDCGEGSVCDSTTEGGCASGECTPGETGCTGMADCSQICPYCYGGLGCGDSGPWPCAETCSEDCGESCGEGGCGESCGEGTCTMCVYQPYQ